MLGGAPDISLGQKYLTTADPFDPNYNTPDLHRDLKKLTCPNTVIVIWKNTAFVTFFHESCVADHGISGHVTPWEGVHLPAKAFIAPKPLIMLKSTESTLFGTSFLIILIYMIACDLDDWELALVYSEILC